MGQLKYEAAVRAQADGREGDALALLLDALATGPQPGLRALIQRARARIEMSDAPMRTHELLLTEAAAIAGDDPSLAAAMLSDAARAALWAGESELAAEAGSSARELALRAAKPIPPSAYLFGLMFGSKPSERATTLDTVLANISIDSNDPAELQEHAVVLFLLDEYPKARLLLEHAIRRARSSKYHRVLPVALDTLAVIDFLTGGWVVADGRSAEALRLARELGQTAQAASCLTTLASIAAARGDEYECRAHLAAARELVPAGHLVASYAASAAALLELGCSQPEKAIAQLESVRDDEGRSVTTPLVVRWTPARWTPDLIEAYVRAGRPADAGELLRAYERRASDSGTPCAIAAAARCRGLLAADDAFDTHFDEALLWHGRTATPFERARTELCFGERLRRARRRPEAIVMLRRALASFERLGATPWAERARRELAPKRRADANADGTALLTAHELQVTSLVRCGLTNRQAASALFVTPKTIEYHLTAIYRKLGVRSRTELAYFLSEQASLLADA